MSAALLLVIFAICLSALAFVIRSHAIEALALAVVCLAVAMVI
jgi:hypothetical protein